MRRYGTIGLAVLLAGALGLALGMSYAERAQIAADRAVVTFIDGDVQVRHGISGWSPARLNDVLNPGDAVKTGEEARAEITIADGYLVRMKENSHLLITHVNTSGLTKLKVFLGGVWVTIEKALTGASKFQVEMPSAVAAVKGTVFRCDVPSDAEALTYVYEGEVELVAGQERVKVAPARYARIRRGARVALASINFDEDDKRAWVQYNRHRDVLRHLGNPRIIVALHEDGIGPASYLASQALAGTLRKLGFPGSSVGKAKVPRFSFDDRGFVRWQQRPPYDFQVVGKVRGDHPERLNGGLYSVRVHGTAHLVRVGSTQPLVSASAVASAASKEPKKAAADALAKLGMRLGAELAPRMIRELMSVSTGRAPVRVAPVGQYTRAQIAALHTALASAPGVVRVTPIPLPGSRFTLAVVGNARPEQIAHYIRTRCARFVGNVSAAKGVVYVSFAPVQTGMVRPPKPASPPPARMKRLPRRRHLPRSGQRPPAGG